MNRLYKGQSLVGTLVAIVIVIVAAVFLMKGGFGKQDPDKARADGKGNTIVGRALLKGDDTKCQEQVRQVRLSIFAQTDPVDDTYPTSLIAIPGLPQGYGTCPIGDEVYEYIPATGEVSCPHPGHEDY